MRKLLCFALLALVVFAAGCSFGDLFVNRVRVHNGLIAKVEFLASKEAKFYEAYFDVADENLSIDNWIVNLRDAYDGFVLAATGLEEYFDETRFASAQQVFAEEYNGTFKPYVDGYISKADVLVKKVEAEGYNYDDLESYFLELDDVVLKFGDAYTTFVNVINLQSDMAASAG